MARKMVVLTGSSSSVLEEVLAHDEAQLQEQLKANPDLLPIEDLGLSGPLMIIGRETSLASGSVDLVGLARSGELLVIEFKTGPQNPDFRHAFAQLIDYGSDLWGMSFEVFESSVPLRYFSSDRCPPTSPSRGKSSLEAAARATWPDLTEEESSRLRERVIHQLESGGFHYVLVAQKFTPSTEQTVRYLNATMQSARFSAVELVRFTGSEFTAFEARTVLKPERTNISKGATPSMSEAKFLDAIADETYRKALEEFFEACRGIALRFEWGSVGTSIRVPTPDRTEPLTIAWVFPPGASGWMGLTNLTIGYDPGSAKNTPSAQPALDRLMEGISRLPGAKPVKAQKLTAREIPPDTAVSSVHELIDLLARLVRDVNGVA